MMYQIINKNTHEIEYETYSSWEVDEMMEYTFDHSDHYIQQITPCNGCGVDSDMRYDAHGVPTGHYCIKCYNDPKKYPYRKDRYATLETHGYGDRMDDDY
tara:strand:- start:74 stop:373 length:300 start_codon:yes stop_codon:yes gene_type:complete